MFLNMLLCQAHLCKSCTQFLLDLKICNLKNKIKNRVFDSSFKITFYFEILFARLKYCLGVFFRIIW